MSGGSLKKARKLAQTALPARRAAPSLDRATVLRRSGTWRALAQAHMALRNYPLRVMHDYRIAPEEALAFLAELQASDDDALKAIEGVSSARRPLMKYGATIPSRRSSARRRPSCHRRPRRWACVKVCSTTGSTTN